jgi:hypothetical protein
MNYNWKISWKFGLHLCILILMEKVPLSSTLFLRALYFWNWFKTLSGEFLYLYFWKMVSLNLCKHRFISGKEGDILRNIQFSICIHPLVSYRSISRALLNKLITVMLIIAHQQVWWDCFLVGWQVQAALTSDIAASSDNVMVLPCILLWCVHNVHLATQLPQSCKYIVIN